jgi:hypothetical protein
LDALSFVRPEVNRASRDWGSNPAGVRVDDVHQFSVGGLDMPHKQPIWVEAGICGVQTSYPGMRRFMLTLRYKLIMYYGLDTHDYLVTRRFMVS